VDDPISSDYSTGMVLLFFQCRKDRLISLKIFFNLTNYNIHL
jgi:hypothetical protein